MFCLGENPNRKQRPFKCNNLISVCIQVFKTCPRKKRRLEKNTIKEQLIYAAFVVKTNFPISLQIFLVRLVDENGLPKQ